MPTNHTVTSSTTTTLVNGAPVQKYTYDDGSVMVRRDNHVTIVVHTSSIAPNGATITRRLTIPAPLVDVTAYTVSVPSIFS